MQIFSPELQPVENENQHSHQIRSSLPKTELEFQFWMSLDIIEEVATT